VLYSYLTNVEITSVFQATNIILFRGGPHSICSNEILKLFNKMTEWVCENYKFFGTIFVRDLFMFRNTLLDNKSYENGNTSMELLNRQLR
jgi:hypothetical protein